MKLYQGVKATSRNPEAATPSWKDPLSDFGRGSEEANKGKSRSQLTSVSQRRWKRAERKTCSLRKVGNIAQPWTQARNFCFGKILEREESRREGDLSFRVFGRLFGVGRGSRRQRLPLKKRRNRFLTRSGERAS